MNTQPCRILMVDDDPNVLAAYRRTAGRTFEMICAEGGRAAMSLLDADKPFAVIISDMRMPEMNGLQFILAARPRSPDSVFMMLTGNADQRTAVDAINKGEIFRFLNKPCGPDQLEVAIRAGLRQYELITAERVLLHETVAGSVKLLMEALEIASPAAFRHQSAIKRIQHEVCAALRAPVDWQISLAAMLCLIGLAAVPARPEETLLDESLVMAAEVGSRLLSHIPRLHSVAKMIRHQRDDGMLPQDLSLTDPSTLEQIGARVVRFSVDLARAEQSCGSRQVAAELLRDSGQYDDRLIKTVSTAADAIAADTAHLLQIRPTKVRTDEIQPGMVLFVDLLLPDGRLLLSKGQTVSELASTNLRHYSRLGLINATVDVLPSRV